MLKIKPLGGGSDTSHLKPIQRAIIELRVEQNKQTYKYFYEQLLDAKFYIGASCPEAAQDIKNVMQGKSQYPLEGVGSDEQGSYWVIFTSKRHLKKWARNCYEAEVSGLEVVQTAGFWQLDISIDFNQDDTCISVGVDTVNAILTGRYPPEAGNGIVQCLKPANKTKALEKKPAGIKPEQKTKIMDTKTNGLKIPEKKVSQPQVHFNIPPDSDLGVIGCSSTPGVFLSQTGIGIVDFGYENPHTSGTVLISQIVDIYQNYDPATFVWVLQKEAIEQFVDATDMHGWANMFQLVFDMARQEVPRNNIFITGEETAKQRAFNAILLSMGRHVYQFGPNAEVMMEVNRNGNLITAFAGPPAVQLSPHSQELRLLYEERNLRESEHTQDCSDIEAKEMAVIQRLLENPPEIQWQVAQ